MRSSVLKHVFAKLTRGQRKTRNWVVRDSDCSWWGFVRKECPSTYRSRHFPCFKYVNLPFGTVRETSNKNRPCRGQRSEFSGNACGRPSKPRKNGSPFLPDSPGSQGKKRKRKKRMEGDLQSTRKCEHILYIHLLCSTHKTVFRYWRRRAPTLINVLSAAEWAWGNHWP